MKQVADAHLRKQSFRPHLFQGYILGKAIANDTKFTRLSGWNQIAEKSLQLLIDTQGLCHFSLFREQQEEKWIILRAR